MKPYIKRYFSLLELFIALSILLLLVPIISIPVYRSLEKHRFDKNEQRIKDYLHYCYNMSLSHQADIILKLHATKEGTLCVIGTEADMGIFLKEDREKFFLKNFYCEILGPFLEITFCSTGIFLPQETTLYFFTKNSRYTAEIDLSKLFNIKSKAKKISQLYQ